MVPHRSRFSAVNGSAVNGVVAPSVDRDNLRSPQMAKCLYLPPFLTVLWIMTVGMTVMSVKIQNICGHGGPSQQNMAAHCGEADCFIGLFYIMSPFSLHGGPITRQTGLVC